jgi:hypothetical protein
MVMTKEDVIDGMADKKLAEANRTFTRQAFRIEGLKSQVEALKKRVAEAEQIIWEQAQKDLSPAMFLDLLVACRERREDEYD